MLRDKLSEMEINVIRLGLGLMELKELLRTFNT